MFFDILKVGAVSCFSPLQSVLTISIFTHHAGGLRHRNSRRLRHRRAARIPADVGIVCVRHRLGADDRHGGRRGAYRARAARGLDRGLVSFLSVGGFATLIAFFPDVWVNLFTSDAGVRAASHQYLSTAAPMYAFIGLASSMYFSSQGAAKVIGPVMAQTARLLFIGTGGWWLSTHDATAQDFFVLAVGLDGGARRVVLPQRDPDAVGTEAGRGARGAAGVV